MDQPTLAAVDWSGASVGTSVLEAHPSVILLRSAKSEIEGKSPSVVIAHSLLGDHKGYGKLWGSALADCNVYALIHAGLMGSLAFTRDEAGVLDMVNEYASALLAVFAGEPFDLMGASFGAILAFSVAQAAKVIGAKVRRVVLLDPPPAVPKELPIPKMVSSIRTAAMGVLLIRLAIEAGADVFKRFPELQTMSEDEIAPFVTAQCFPYETSTEKAAENLLRIQRQLQVYRHCRLSFHVLSAGVSAFRSISDEPALLLVTSTERWPTFKEMFIGVKHDDLESYGPSIKMSRPGRHIAMINRCIGIQDAEFTGILEKFFGDRSLDEQGWTNLPTIVWPKPSVAMSDGAGLASASDALRALLAILAPNAADSQKTAPVAAPATTVGASAAAMQTALRQVADELLPNASAD